MCAFRAVRYAARAFPDARHSPPAYCLSKASNTKADGSPGH